MHPGARVAFEWQCRGVAKQVIAGFSGMMLRLWGMLQGLMSKQDSDKWVWLVEQGAHPQRMATAIQSFVLPRYLGSKHADALLGGVQSFGLLTVTASCFKQRVLHHFLYPMFLSVASK